MTELTNEDGDQLTFVSGTPIVYVLSDARGEMAVGVVEAAADQFSEEAVIIKVLGNVKSVDDVKRYLDRNIDDSSAGIAVFHTIVDRNLRRDIRRELDKRGIPSIDLLGPAVTILSTLTGEEPKNQVGRRTSQQVIREDA